MANEIYYSSMSDLKMSFVLMQDYHQLLADFVSLSNLSVYRGSIAGSGSDTIKVAQLQLAYAMAAVAEGSSVTNTALTTGIDDIAVARQAIAFQESDFMDGIGKVDGAKLQALARWLATSASNRETDMICSLFPSASASVGSTGVDLSTDDIYSALFTLQLSVNPVPFHCVLHQQQWNDFMDDLRGQSGPQQYVAATQDNLRAKGPGYKGEWNGVEFHTSDSCGTANSGADRVGAMFSMGAIHHADMRLNINVPGAGVVSDSQVVIGWERSERAGDTTMVGNRYVGFSLQEQARIVKIVTDA